MTTSRDIEIRNAIPQGVEPFYQPIISFKEREKVSYEVLGRLKVRDEILAPPELLSSFERSPCMAEFDRRILSLAVKQVASWIHDDDLDVHIHVNASFQALCRTDYAVLVGELLRAERVRPEYLTIEVLETCGSFWLSPAMLQTIRDLRWIGVNIAVDDFPCWEYPQELLDAIRDNRGLVQKLKLDRSLVAAACGYDLKRNILESQVAQEKMNEMIRYIDCAHKLGLEVVAEGVEDEADEQVVKHCGADAFQGYYIGQPVPAYQAYHQHQKPLERRSEYRV